MRVADYLVSRIEELGIKRIYGVTGRGSLFLTDAVAKTRKLDWVALHHEQSAGFAAIAEAQYNKMPSAVIVSSGCASTNLLTPLLLAWQDFIPVVFISGQHYSHETQRFTQNRVRTFGQQETDIVPIVETLTKWSGMLTDKKIVRETIDNAFVSMMDERKGPIWIDVPLDLQSATIEDDDVDVVYPRMQSKSTACPTNDDIRYLFDKLSNAKRPVILIGSGVEASNIGPKLLDFCLINSIPIVFANTAVDVLSTNNLNVIGAVGAMGGSRAAAMTVQKSDFLLVLGHRLSSTTIGDKPKTFAPHAELCIVDIDFTEIKAFRVDYDRLIHSELSNFMNSLITLNLGISETRQKWLEASIKVKSRFEQEFLGNSTENSIDIYDLAHALEQSLPEDSILVTDSGFPELILPTNFKIKKGQRFLHPSSQGSMGFAIPAAIGAALASKKLVCVVVGDGSIMMNIQELQTIRHLNLHVVILVVNNDAYGIIRKRQTELFRGRTIGTDSSNGITCPNFERVAWAFGFKFKRVTSIQELEGAFESIFLHSKSPWICEVPGSQSQEYLRIAQRPRSQSKPLGGGLEDQFPFLDLNELEKLLE